jgi:hypothetical protein
MIRAWSRRGGAGDQARLKGQPGQDEQVVLYKPPLEDPLGQRALAHSVKEGMPSGPSQEWVVASYQVLSLHVFSLPS